MKTLSTSRKPRCYIAGRISGRPVIEVFNSFSRASNTIAHRGYEPVNPLYNGLDFSAPWLFHMVVDIWKLLRCRYVYFQQGWEQSRGARMEHWVSTWLGKNIIYEEKTTEGQDVYQERKHKIHEHKTNQPQK